MSELKLGRGFALPVDVVTEAIGIVATRGAGKSYASAVLMEETHAAGVPFVVLDPSGVYHGLRANADGTKAGLPVYVLGGPHGDLPLEEHHGSLIADVVVDSGHSFALDLSDFTKTKMRRFVAEFLERLYDRKARSRTTLLLVVDEADEFAPQKPRGDTINSLAAMETIAKRGRARGLGIVMITQRTQALNKDVLDLIETLVAMRQLAERSRESVKGWIADKDLRDEAGIIESLQALPTGTAWVWSPLRGILEKVAIRRIRTFDSYATPKPGQAKAEPTHRAELDLDTLGEQMRATAERAKANDPRELHKRLRDLERQLSARPSETIVETIEVRVPVEVSVLDEALVQRLEFEVEDLLRIVETVSPLQAAVDQIREALRAAKGATDAQPPARRTEPAPARAPRPAPAPRREPRTTARADSTEDATISRPQQKILNALAWFEAIGVTAPRRPPLAAVAGVSSKSSGFRANVSTLSGLGLIVYPGGGRIALTAEGRDLAEPPAAMPTEEDLQDAIYRMVSGPQAALLQQLVAVYPEPLNREELAARAGVSALSSGFRANVSTLSGFELLGYPSPGLVAASDLLFPGSVRA